MTPLEHLHVAMKRARHFAGRAGLTWEGPFSLWPGAFTDVAGPLVLAHNMCWLLDGDPATSPEIDEDERLGVLVTFAQGLNAYIDTHPIEGDTEAEHALACFLSRVPLGDLSGCVARARVGALEGANL